MDAILEIINRCISLETQAIAALQLHINKQWENAVQTIHNSGGRVIVSGIGKSAIIAQKIVATLNSTGTPAIFMHAADAIHGDLGMIQKDDVIILISKSGESEEVKVLIPSIKKFGNKIIAICGNEKSFLSQHADFFLNCFVSQEACPNNLAPTTSTTAQMVIGDAIAIALLELKGFTANDFARFHPGGALGKQLYLQVEDVINNNQKPQVHYNANLAEVLLEMTSNRLGATAVIENEKVIGIITDGDIRRLLEQNKNTENIIAGDIMHEHPKMLSAGTKAVNALKIMQENKISQMIITKDGNYLGMFHLHDLLREGIV